MPKLKLSEAIMLGSITGPQIKGHMVDDADGSCALGAAFKAAGIPLALELRPLPTTVWPWLSRWCNCPVCTEGENEVTLIITGHLNDTHNWTREKIAEWVARIEPAELSANVTCEATVVQNCEDQTGELCGKTCVEGSYLCEEHEAEVANGR